MIEQKFRFKLAEKDGRTYWYDEKDQYVYMLKAGQRVFHSWLCAGSVWEVFRKSIGGLSIENRIHGLRRRVEQPVFIPGKYPPFPAGRFVV